MLEYLKMIASGSMIVYGLWLTIVILGLILTVIIKHLKDSFKR